MVEMMISFGLLMNTEYRQTASSFSGGSRVQIMTVTSLFGVKVGFKRGSAGLYCLARLEAIFESTLPHMLETC